MKHKSVTILFLLTAIPLFYFLYLGRIDLLWLIIWGLTYLIVTAFGSAMIQWNYFLKSTNAISDPKKVLLTFDDGPHPRFTPQILDQLKEHNIKAVFFLIGKNAENYPAIVNRILAEGHTIGNHSYSHHHFLPLFSKGALRKDINQCTEVLYRITGLKTKLFRPPFGVTTPRYQVILKEKNMVSIGWSLRSMDTTIKTVSRLTEKIAKNIDECKIVLFHDNQQVTVDSLTGIINIIRNRNLSFELPEDCFEEIYE